VTHITARNKARLYVKHWGGKAAVQAVLVSSVLPLRFVGRDGTPCAAC